LHIECYCSVQPRPSPAGQLHQKMVLELSIRVSHLKESLDNETKACEQPHFIYINKGYFLNQVRLLLFDEVAPNARIKIGSFLCSFKQIE